jgi:RNA polymerase sigma-32 factor
MYATAALPIPAVEAGLSRYLNEIKKFPLLTPEDEFALAKRWREQGDRDAAYRLVTSHLRLVAKIAMRYRGLWLATRRCRFGRQHRLNAGGKTI